MSEKKIIQEEKKQEEPFNSKANVKPQEIDYEKEFLGLLEHYNNQALQALVNVANIKRLGFLGWMAAQNQNPQQ